MPKIKDTKTFFYFFQNSHAKVSLYESGIVVSQFNPQYTYTPPQFMDALRLIKLFANLLTHFPAFLQLISLTHLY